MTGIGGLGPVSAPLTSNAQPVRTMAPGTPVREESDAIAQDQTRNTSEGDFYLRLGLVYKVANNTNMYGVSPGNNRGGQPNPMRDPMLYTTNLSSLLRLASHKLGYWGSTLGGRTIRTALASLFILTNHEFGHNEGSNSYEPSHVGFFDIRDGHVVRNYHLRYTALNIPGSLLSHLGGLYASQVARDALALHMAHRGTNYFDVASYTFASYDLGYQAFPDASSSDVQDYKQGMGSMYQIPSSEVLTNTELVIGVGMQALDPLALVTAFRTGQWLASSNNSVGGIPFIGIPRTRAGVFPRTAFNLGPLGPEYQGHFLIKIPTSQNNIAMDINVRGGDGELGSHWGTGIQLEHVPFGTLPLYASFDFKYWKQPDIPLRAVVRLPDAEGTVTAQVVDFESPYRSGHVALEGRLGFQVTPNVAIIPGVSYKQGGWDPGNPLSEELRVDFGLDFETN